jgi:molecular chaperone GrpE (heat shock protein)
MSNEGEGNMGQTTSLLLEQERDTLDSWKEIAAYLNRNVRTVQRWEKREGLPVHRQVHERASSVSACKKEIDEWRKQRSRTSNEITEYQKEIELEIERLKTRLLVKHMREALAIALDNDSL